MRLRLKPNRLLELVSRSALSQNHLALKIGLSRGHWSGIVNGRHLYPSAKTRTAILEVFQVPLEELFEIDAGNALWADTDFRRAIAERYLIDSELGQGGMGAVYLARDVRHGRTVAIKVISSEAVSGIGLSQFHREISTVAKLQHSNILPFIDSGEAAGCPFYVMPWIRGGSLRQRLDERKRLGLPDTLRLLRGMADALHYAHAEHVLHCDVKPENVLLQGDHAWMMDFGIARKLRSEIAWPPGNELDLSAGTPAYVSPEQAAGERDLDARSDVYSLGCLVFEMLSGHVPFGAGSTREIVSRRFIVPPPPLRDFAPEVPGAVESAIEHAMQLLRERRPGSAVEFADEVERAARHASRIVSAVSLAGARTMSRIRSGRRATSRSPLGGLMRSLFQWSDVRDAYRGLARSPVVTVCAVLCLGLGLGATSAMYSAFDRALLRPLPLPEPDRLVSVFRTTPHFNSGPFSAPNYTDLARETRRLERLAAITWSSVLLTLPEEGVRVPSFRVTGSFFPTLGIQALRGRLLGPGDDLPDAAPVLVMSEEIWRLRFAADSALVGTTIRVDGSPRTVVGILPRDFRIPMSQQFLSGGFWLPMRFSDGEMSARRSNSFMAVGRLAADASVEAADAELHAIFERIVEAHPGLRGEQVRVVPIQQEGNQAVRTPLMLVLGAVGFVLLIAASNVASLLLARGVQRRREMAVRIALGGRRWAVMRPVLVESLMLAALGVLLGLGLATAGVRTIGTLAAERIPQLAGLSVDLRVFGFALVLAVVVAALCGAVPAWQAASADPQDALRGGTGGGPGRAHHRVLGSLVVVEVALSLVLLLGAGLVMKGFAGLMTRAPGFDPNRLLTLEVTVSREDYAGRGTVEQFLEPVLAAIRQQPGVEAAAAISLIPYDNWGWNFNIRYEGQPDTDPTRLPITENRVVTPEFFAVTQQGLVSGRLFNELDGQGDSAPVVVVVNEALVRRDFENGEAIGKRFHSGDNGFATIVGVVGDIRNVGPFREPAPEVYWTWRQAGRGTTSFPVMVRVSGDPGAMARPVLAAIHGVDRGAAVTKVAPMSDVIGRSVGRPRFYLTLLGVFAVVALLLAMAGLYGVIGYSVAQRTREIGIRSALGSTGAGTVWLVVKRGLSLVAAGLFIGLLGGVAVTRLLRGLLYGVSPLDPITWVIASAALAAAALVATVLPARRAAQVDAAISLRME